MKFARRCEVGRNSPKEETKGSLGAKSKRLRFERAKSTASCRVALMRTNGSERQRLAQREREGGPGWPN